MLKNINFFTKIIITVCLISLVALLQKQDARELRQDIIDLNLLELLAQEFSTKGIQYSSIFEEFEIWLANEHEDSYEQWSELRTSISRWLSKTDIDMQGAKFFGKSGPQKYSAPYFFYEVDSKYINRKLFYKSKNKFKYISKNRVRSLILIFNSFLTNQWSQPLRHLQFDYF